MFSLKPQRCLLLQAKVVFSSLEEHFLNIHYFIAFLSPQDSNGSLVPWVLIFFLDCFQRWWSFHPCLIVSFSLFLLILLFKALQGLLNPWNYIPTLFNVFKNTYSCKEKWNVFWWWITKHIVGILVLFSFLVRNLSFLDAVYSAEVLTCHFKPFSLHYPVQNISLPFWSGNLWDNSSRTLSHIMALHFFHEMVSMDPEPESQNHARLSQWEIESLYFLFCCYLRNCLASWVLKEK